MKVSAAKSKKEAKKRLQAERKRIANEKKEKERSQQQQRRPPATKVASSKPGSQPDRPLVGKTISGPTNFSHDTHVGWDADRGFEIRNIPPEWKNLFKAAGVKKSEIEDPATRKLIMNTVRASMMMGAAPAITAAEPRRLTAAPLPPEGGPAPPTGGPPPPVSGGPSPPASFGGPGLPPRNGATGRKTSIAAGTKCSAKWSGDGQFYPAVIESERDEGGTKYYKVTFTEYGNSEEVLQADVKVEEAEDVEQQPAPGSLSAALLAGKGSLKATDVDLSTLKKGEEENLVNSIAKAVQARRAGMVSTYGVGETPDENGDDWDDEEDESWLDF